MTHDAPIGVLETLRATPVSARYLLTGVLINQLGAFVQPFLVLYLTFRGASLGLAGLCVAAYSVGSILGTLLGGELTGRCGPRTTIVAVMACSGPLVAVIPWLSGPGTAWALITVVALAGLVTQAYRPAAAVLLSDLMPERYQVMAFSMMRIALNIGAALAPLIAAGLILIDWDLLYWFDGTTALVYAVLAFAMLPRTIPRTKPEPAGSGTVADGRSPYAVMVRDTRFLLYLVAVLLGTVTYVQSMTALPLQIVNDGHPTGLYSVVLTISSVLLVTCELKITTYVTRLPTPVAVLLGHVVYAFGLAAYALSARSSGFVIAGAVLAVTGLMIAGPSMFAYPARFPAAVKARYLAMMQTVGGLASSVGLAFGVVVWSGLGGGFWVLAGVLNVIAGLLAMAGMVRPARSDPAADPGRPVVVVGFVGVTLAALAEFNADRSVIFVEEPDVVRKRRVREKLAGQAFVRDLIEWEYHLPGKADEFYNAHPDLDPAAIVPAIEYATPFAARLAERYGLPGAGFAAASVLRDKALLRQVSSSAGIANPVYGKVSSPADVLAFLRDQPGPVVLKPANRQASVGIRVVREAAEVDAAWSDCLDQDEGIFVPDRPMELSMLVEQYLDGPSYSVEMLVRQGSALFTNVTHKQLFPGPRPVTLVNSVPADIPSELAERLGVQTIRVVDAVGFRDGIIHCEWIVSNGIPYLVECAGRAPGNGIMDIIQRAYPVELFRCYYAVMSGSALPGEMPTRAGAAAAARFVAVPPGVVESVRGIEDARRAPGVFLADVPAAPGDEFTDVRDAWDLAGIVMTSAETPAEALRLAEAAAGLIRVEMRESVVGGKV